MLDYIITFQLGYSLDKVYQVGIAKSFKLKPCRMNYARIDATNLDPAPTLKTITNLSQQGGCLLMQVPAQQRGLHVTLISVETSSDVSASNMCFELLNAL
jgi:hypothetical protein